MLSCINGLFESVFNISIFVPSHLCFSPIPLYNPLYLCKSFLSQKLPEAPEDGGQQEGEGPKWVFADVILDVVLGVRLCTVWVKKHVCLSPGVCFVFVWYHLNVCALQILNMKICHRLTIIHVIWIIFRGYRYSRHLMKVMKRNHSVLLSDSDMVVTSCLQVYKRWFVSDG